jgi:hypothetical protein
VLGLVGRQPAAGRGVPRRGVHCARRTAGGRDMAGTSAVSTRERLAPSAEAHEPAAQAGGHPHGGDPDPPRRARPEGYPAGRREVADGRTPFTAAGLGAWVLPSGSYREGHDRGAPGRPLARIDPCHTDGGRRRPRRGAPSWPRGGCRFYLVSMGPLYRRTLRPTRPTAKPVDEVLAANPTRAHLRGAGVRPRRLPGRAHAHGETPTRQVRRSTAGTPHGRRAAPPCTLRAPAGPSRSSTTSSNRWPRGRQPSPNPRRCGRSHQSQLLPRSR